MKRQSAILTKSGVRWPLALTVVLFVLQTPLLAQAGPEEHIGLPLDWSNHHIIFTNGASPEVSAQQARDPRSWINWAQRSAFLFPRQG